MTEGFVALYEPFVDTIVVCTITALVIIITGTWDPSVDPSAGVQLTSDAFESTISWFPYILTIAVVLVLERCQAVFQEGFLLSR